MVKRGRTSGDGSRNSSGRTRTTQSTGRASTTSDHGLKAMVSHAKRTTKFIPKPEPDTQARGQKAAETGLRAGVRPRAPRCPEPKN